MKPKQTFANLSALADQLRNKLDTMKTVLLYAYNGTGKTRLSMMFKDAGKKTIHRPFTVGDNVGQPLSIAETIGDTLYFNAFTEDLFHWNNDLEGDADRRLLLNRDSRFFQGLFELEMDNRIRPLLQRYTDFDFRIDTEEWAIRFSRILDGQFIDNMKVSRGEENIFIWCFFLAIVQLALDGAEAYQWVKYVYIDDPISSLDEHNAITVGSHLAQLLNKADNPLKVVISSHHPLFFNVMHNELDARKSKKVVAYFLSRSRADGSYSLAYTGATPFFHHVAILAELYKAEQTGELYTYHFNMLRSVLEKSASFHGFSNFSACIAQDADDPERILYSRLINILSHGNYSLFEPQSMLDENKTYFRKILHDFLKRYPFNPDLFPQLTEEGEEKTMTEFEKQKLGKTLWNIADQLRGAMNADDFRDYMLAFLFLRYLSDNYEAAAQKELGSDYPKQKEGERRPPLTLWYEQNEQDIPEFEKLMRRKVHYVIEPQYLWANIAEMARTQHVKLLNTLQAGFKYIEEESFASVFQGLFSEINLASEKLGKTYGDRNDRLCKIIKEIAEGLKQFSTDSDTLGDAYEYLIGQFAAGSGKKAGEFYTPQRISDILSAIVTLDSQEPATGQRSHLDSVFDFACGSGSLLLNIRKRMGQHGISKIYGQEKNITTYNLARMNMLLHGVKDSEFDIFHGDTLLNDWDMLRESNPSRMPKFDAVVANPPFSYRWEPTETLADDVRFKNHGLAPKSAADFAFLLHGFHFLKEDGVMAIILPHGVLFRSGAEARIRTKLLKDGHIDTVIGLPANLFFSTGIPVCILVLKKCKKPDDVLFINASEYFDKGKRQNQLLRTDEMPNGEIGHIEKIIHTYQFRKEEPRYARRVSMEEIEKNDFNLNISRYVSTAEAEEEVKLDSVHAELVSLDSQIKFATKKHNEFLKELGLALLP